MPYGLATLNWPRFFPSPILFLIKLVYIEKCRNVHTELTNFWMGNQAICFQYRAWKESQSVQRVQVITTFYTLSRLFWTIWPIIKSWECYETVRNNSTYIYRRSTKSIILSNSGSCWSSGKCSFFYGMYHLNNAIHYCFLWLHLLMLDQLHITDLSLNSPPINHNNPWDNGCHLLMITR